MRTKTIVMMGRPGSGKGTQAKMLAEKLGYAVFSTGGRYREIAAEDSYIGRKIADIINHGWLTPAWFATYLFTENLLTREPEQGVVFEGACRTEPEAHQFEEINNWLERPYHIFFLNVPEEELKQRLMKRAQEHGRKDDLETSIPLRFAEYERHTMPALSFFRSLGKITDINGLQAPEAVFAEVWAKVEKLP